MALHNLTPEQIAEYRESFSFFDKNGDGKITREELGKVMSQLGSVPVDAEIDAMIKDLDRDGDGKIDFNEFLNQHADVIDAKPDGTLDEEVLAAFKVYDKDSSGTITEAEVRLVLADLGLSTVDHDVDAMMKQAETDGDGVVNYVEFLKAWNALKR